MAPIPVGVRGESRVASAVLVAMLAVFVAVMSLIVAGAFARRSAPEYSPTLPGTGRVVVDRLFRDTVTLDARDERRWVYFDLDRAMVLAEGDTTGWDLAARRFSIVAKEGILDLGALAFDSVLEPPPPPYIPTRFASDTVNPAIARWYEYNFLSHLMEPNGHVYAVAVTGGGHAKLSILSYYCPGLVSGCITFEYVFQPDPSRTFF